MLLVTGAGGTVGSALVTELRAMRQPVRAAYHSARAAAAAAVDPGGDAVALDFAEPDSLRDALQGVEALFLLGAMGAEQTRLELSVVDAARAAAVSRIVKLSVWRADEQLTPIARLHRPVEEALQATGSGWTLLRPNFHMQNFSRQMAAAIRDDGVIAQPVSRAAISFVDARDVAAAAARVLTSGGHEGRVYDLTGPRALSYPQVAETFSAVLGRPVRYLAQSDAQARQGMRARGVPDFHAAALIEVAAAYRDGGAERVTTDLADLTGRPARPLEQFVRDHRSSFG